MTCVDAACSYESSVTQAQKKGDQIDVPERVEGWQLREKDQHHCHHNDEVIQPQGTIRRKTGVHDLIHPVHTREPICSTKMLE